MINRRVQVKNTPAPGLLSAETFSIEQQLAPELNAGEILLRVIYLSIDAGSRAQLDEQDGYLFRTRPGETMAGTGAVGEVLESRHPAWQKGDYAVTGMCQWQSLLCLEGNAPLLTKIDPQAASPEAYLGVLGIVGFTAWIGMMKLAQPSRDDTVLVSAAAGATGSVAGQIAKTRNARVIGIAGGADKCDWVVNTLGLDACIDYKAGNIDDSIKKYCPNGVDVYFDNVGGHIQQAAYDAMNIGGRIALCGMVGQYSGEKVAPGPNLMAAVIKRLTLKGFLASDHFELFPEFLRQGLQWYQNGQLHHEVTVTDGLENIHEAINSLTSGSNIGKQLCKIDQLHQA